MSLQRLESKIDRYKRKYSKMQKEYERLYSILINSEHRKKEKDLITQMRVTEADVMRLGEHYH